MRCCRVRRDGMDILKKQEKDHVISQDDHKRLDTEVQKATDQAISEIDQLLAAKERRSSPSGGSMQMSEAEAPAAVSSDPQSASPVVASRPVAPRHVAIIMDGNGRWASSRGLPRAEAIARRRRSVAPHGAGRRRTWHRLHHHLLVQLGKLVASGVRDSAI